MTPDPDYNDKLAADEQARLAVKVEQLDAGTSQGPFIRTTHPSA